MTIVLYEFAADALGARALDTAGARHSVRASRGVRYSQCPNSRLRGPTHIAGSFVLGPGGIYAGAGFSPAPSGSVRYRTTSR
jgi:hypothetical protein